MIGNMDLVFLTLFRPDSDPTFSDGGGGLLPPSVLGPLSPDGTNDDSPKTSSVNVVSKK